MKILFITHSLNLLYGAAKSLHLLLISVENDQFDVMFQKRILKKYTIDELRKYVGPKCGKIFFCDLPTDYTMMQYKTWDNSKPLKYNIRELGSRIKRWLLYRFHRNEIRQIINNGKYNYIHINSSVMYPLLSENQSMVIHIRELLPNRISNYAQKQFKKAKSLICIEETVRRHLLHCCPKIDKARIQVLTNPFDMSDVETLDKNTVFLKLRINPNCVVFSIAGTITDGKGVDFVIESFVSSSHENKTLLVVGNNETVLGRALKNKYRNVSSVRFLGEMNDMNQIYSISDYIVRGEAEFCTGRTVYEALFSGCSVLLPGEQKDIEVGYFLPDQIDRVFFYHPLNLESLSYFFSTLNKVQKKRVVNSNVNKYYSSFYKILSGPLLQIGAKREEV